MQNDGSEQQLILKDLNLVPDLYCNLFIITRVLDEVFALSGGRNETLTLRKDHVKEKFDHHIKSGAGKLIGVKLVPTGKGLRLKSMT